MRWLWILSLVAGCYNGFSTEEGQLRLTPDDVATAPFGGFTPDSPLLRGTELCVDIACGPDASCPGDLEVGLCFETAAEGAVRWTDSACVEADLAGSGTWLWEPIPCPANDAGYAPIPDSVPLEVVDPAEVEARLDQWVEAAVVEAATPHSALPEDWVVPEGEPFRIASSGHLRLPILLTHPDHEAAVAWNDSHAVVEAVPTAGAAATIERPGDGWVVLTAPAGSASDVVLELSGAQWTIGRVAGVADAPESIELVVVYDSESGSPLGARAVVRDATGELVYGTPVRWTVLEGALSVSPGGELPGPDYAILEDACVAPEDRGGPRTAVIEVSHGGVRDQLTLKWRGQAGDADPMWLPSEDCQGPSKGCGCRSAPLPASWMVVGLALLGLRRRRAP